MDNEAVVREYFSKFFSGTARHSLVRDYLMDDFNFQGPMMEAHSAQEYIGQLQSMGDEFEMHAHVRKAISQGDSVAVLVDFQGPRGPMTSAQWFELREGKICRLEVIYDPRPFLQGSDSRDQFTPG